MTVSVTLIEGFHQHHVITCVFDFEGQASNVSARAVSVFTGVRVVSMVMLCMCAASAFTACVFCPSLRGKAQLCDNT